MKTLLLFVLGLASAYAAGPTLRIQSVPFSGSNDAIHPDLMPGVAGVGINGGGLPCIGCFGLPAGALALPPSYYIDAPYQGTDLCFYNSVEIGNLTGPATITLQVTEAGTGKLDVSHLTTEEHAYDVENRPYIKRLGAATPNGNPGRLSTTT